MEQFRRLERGKLAALAQALQTECPQQKSEHEEQARAYAKIIDVLSREGQEAVMRLRS
jgi:hypothetical protein